MKRVLLAFVAVISMVSFMQVAVADERSEEILAKLTQSISAMSRYECSFSVEMNGADLVQVASYSVDGARFRLSIADQVIYGDGAQRFTVNNTTREVVKERVDDLSPMIITNPAKAFLSLTESFETKMLEEDIVELIPRDASSLLESSLLSVDDKTNLPTEVSYYSNGDHIRIRIIEFKGCDEVIPDLDELPMSDYDIIDIR